MKRVSRLAATLAIISMATPGFAQTQSQQDRLNRIAQFVVTAPMCEKLGMTLDPELAQKAAAAVEVETAGWGIEAEQLERLQVETVKRQGAILSSDLATASSNAKSEAQLRGVKSILLGYGQTCMAATRDPIFSTLVVAPAGYDLDKNATEMADSMLEVGGLASWQTPEIQVRGDLMMLAGTCRSKIGPSRSDALVKEFGQSDAPRVRDYYSRSFDEGLADPSMIETLAGCNRAIAGFRAKAR